MGPITCRLPSGTSSSTRRAAATIAVAHGRPRTAPVALTPPSSCRNPFTTSQISRTPSPSPSSSLLQQQQLQQLQPRQSQFRLPARPRAQTTASPRTTSTSYRPYHSYDHPSNSSPFSPTERTILTAAYAHVPKHGFTQKALALGARDAGYLDISTNVLPDGVFSLIQWHLVSQREALAVKATVLFGGEGEEGGGERFGLGKKVEMLTWERLTGNKAVVGRLQEALAIMAQPSYIPGSLKELAKLSDEIWFLVGDTAVDPSWYTKRASLSATYASAELFMTSDHSEGFVETRKFLQRRLSEAHDIGGTLKSLGQWVGFTANAGLNVLRSKGMRI
ncbi:Ubiquinone biosynthesis protein coq9, mitochondrial [Cytospora mali]|uniref:Ubiquinone biosynthesis protein n=1 Tax=Cytospora mali TaxID=578113 RepID=A0A194W6Z9_CYTMA|nr:Ubiquinone biosynthesis protein coq9, mitochondrial [Valsa mali]